MKSTTNLILCMLTVAIAACTLCTPKTDNASGCAEQVIESLWHSSNTELQQLDISPASLPSINTGSIDYAQLLIQLKSHWLYAAITVIFIVLLVLYGFLRPFKRIKNLKRQIALLHQTRRPKKTEPPSQREPLHQQDTNSQTGEVDEAVKNREREVEQENINQSTIEAFPEEIKRLQAENGELQKTVNSIKLLYGTESVKLNPNDIKSLQMAQSLLTNKTYHPATDRMLLKQWLNLSKNKFAEKLESRYPQVKGRLIDICYLAALGVSIDEMAQILQVNNRTIERYMDEISLKTKLSPPGKKGFVQLINRFLALKP